MWYAMMQPMKPILIIQNIRREYPGMIQQLLDEKSIVYEIVMMEERAGNPPDLKNYQALMVLGGPDSANDTTPKMLAEIKLVQQALAQQLPFLGICLGHQVVVKAAGGKVVHCPKREIGWGYTIQLTPTGKIDPLFHSLPEAIPTFQLHGEMVQVVDGITVLATGDNCPVQVVKVGRQAYGVQCHFELHDQLYETWLNEDSDLQKLDRTEMEEYWQKVKDGYLATGRKLMENWLNLL